MTALKTISLCLMAFLLIGSCTSSTDRKTESTKTEEVAPVEKRVGIAFHHGSWESALAKAKSENKLIFLDVFASWCGPCKMLKKQTFSNANVGIFYNENFISVEIDGEKGEGIKLAQQYRVEAYPSLFFINGDGQVVLKTMGFLNPEQFIQFGESVLKK